MPDLPISPDWPDWLPRDALSVGSLFTPSFDGPGSAGRTVTLKLPIAWDPRTVLWTRVDGERVTPRYVIDRGDGVLSGFETHVTPGTDSLEIRVEVERTGPGEEPGHLFEFYVFSGLPTGDSGDPETP